MSSSSSHHWYDRVVSKVEKTLASKQAVLDGQEHGIPRHAQLRVAAKSGKYTRVLNAAEILSAPQTQDEAANPTAILRVTMRPKSSLGISSASKSENANNDNGDNKANNNNNNNDSIYNNSNNQQQQQQPRAVSADQPMSQRTRKMGGKLSPSTIGGRKKSGNNSENYNAAVAAFNSDNRIRPLRPATAMGLGTKGVKFIQEEPYGEDDNVPEFRPATAPARDLAYGLQGTSRSSTRPSSMYSVRAGDNMSVSDSIVESEDFWGSSNNNNNNSNNNNSGNGGNSSSRYTPRQIFSADPLSRHKLQQRTLSKHRLLTSLFDDKEPSVMPSMESDSESEEVTNNIGCRRNRPLSDDYSHHVSAAVATEVNPRVLPHKGLKNADEWFSSWYDSYNVETMSFSSVALYVEAKLNELEHEHPIENGKPNSFRTAVCFDLLTRLSAVFGRYQSLLRRLMDELLLSVYVDWKLEETPKTHSLFEGTPWFSIINQMRDAYQSMEQSLQSLTDENVELRAKLARYEKDIGQMQPKVESLQLEITLARRELSDMQMLLQRERAQFSTSAQLAKSQWDEKERKYKAYSSEMGAKCSAMTMEMRKMVLSSDLLKAIRALDTFHGCCFRQWEDTCNELANSEAVRFGLQSSRTIKLLCQPGETAETLFTYDDKELLRRWLNFHVRSKASSRVASNLTHDLADSELFFRLMRAIVPESMQLPADEVEEYITDKNIVAVDAFAAHVAKVTGIPELIDAGKYIANGDETVNIFILYVLFQMFPCLTDDTIKDMAKFQADLGVNAINDRIEKLSQVEFTGNQCYDAVFVLAETNDLDKTIADTTKKFRKHMQILQKNQELFNRLNSKLTLGLHCRISNRFQEKRVQTPEMSPSPPETPRFEGQSSLAVEALAELVAPVEILTHEQQVLISKINMEKLSDLFLMPVPAPSSSAAAAISAASQEAAALLARAKDEAVLTSIKDFLTSNSDVLCKIYRFYWRSASPVGSIGLSPEGLWKLLSEAKLAGNKRTQISRKIWAALFFKSASNLGESANNTASAVVATAATAAATPTTPVPTKAAKSSRGKKSHHAAAVVDVPSEKLGLTLSDFSEYLVRTADSIKNATKEKDLPKIFRKIATTILNEAEQEASEWFKAELQKPEIKRSLHKNATVLKRVYKWYSVNDEIRSNTLKVRGLLRMLGDIGFLSGDVTADFVQSLLCCILDPEEYQKCEGPEQMELMALTHDQFLEALCAVCIARQKDPFVPMYQRISTSLRLVASRAKRKV